MTTRELKLMMLKYRNSRKVTETDYYLPESDTVVTVSKVETPEKMTDN